MTTPINNRIVFIPVRKGSKGIPGKNLKLLNDKPLINWILDTLFEKPIADEIWVATDCDEMIRHIGQYYSTINIYQREAQNAQDESPTIDVVLEFIRKYNCAPGSSFMIAQATVPFSSNEDFNNAFIQFESAPYDSLVACKRIKSFIWDKQGTCLSYPLNSKPRRQEFEGTLIESGAFHIATVEGLKQEAKITFGKVGIYELKPGMWIDIDEKSDWAVAETLIKFKQNTKQDEVSELRVP